MTTPDTEAEIVRLHFAEHWKVGTIAAQLGVHPDVVRRILGIGVARSPDAAPRLRLVDPFRDFIASTLASYPALCSTRLHDMLCQRGFRGSARTLRAYVATVRPQRHREVFLHTEPLIGEQAQIDWAYVGKLPVTGGERALWLFVIVLSHSRALWGEFVLDLSVYSLCRSLVRAAKALGGVTRQWLFDNPKTVVLERIGHAARFHPTLLALCAEMRAQPRLCGVRQPQHKGDLYGDEAFAAAVAEIAERGLRDVGALAVARASRRNRVHFRSENLGQRLCDSAPDDLAPIVLRSPGKARPGVATIESGPLRA